MNARLRRPALAPGMMAVCLAAAVAVPAAAQITATEVPGLSGGRVYRSNAAYDPVNEVYLVIVARPPVTGRFLNKQGVQIGPDFEIASEPGFSAWASIAFGGPPNDPAFLVTYTIADLNQNPKYGRLVRYVPGSAPSVSPPSWITDVASEWLYSEKAQNVWNGQAFVVGTRVRPPGFSQPAPQLNLFGMNGVVSAPVILADGSDYLGSPAVTCSNVGVCLALGFRAGIPTGYSGGSYARLFDGLTITPTTDLLSLSPAGQNEDQSAAFVTHTGFFLAQWWRGAGGGFIDTRLVAPDGSMSAIDLNRGIGPGAGTNVLAYNPSTQTSLLITKLGPAELTAIELGDDGYPIRPDNFVLLTPWDGSVLDYLPSIAANPVDAQWLVTAELVAAPKAWLVQGQLIAPSNQPPTILTASPMPAATENTPYNQFLVATGSQPPYTWALVSGVLPPGIALTGNAVSGTPTAPGTYAFRLRVTGTDNQFSEKDFTLKVNATINVGPGGAGAHIDLGNGFTLFPGNAYRNNVAYDPVNEVYLVIVQRPPVTGRFLNKFGVPIGPDFEIATEPGFSAWVSIAFGGPPNDPAFLVTYTIADLNQNPKYGRLVRFVPGGSPQVSAPSFITNVTSEWLYSEKAKNVWNGQEFVVGTRVRPGGAGFPTPQVNLFRMDGTVSPPVILGDGADYYGSPAIACAANGVCLAIGFKAGIPTGYSGGTYARLFNGATLAPQGLLFNLDAGRPNEDQGVVYQDHTGLFLTHWFRGTGGGFIDTRLVSTEGTMSVLDLARGIGPGAGTNVFAYNAATRTTLLATKYQPDARLIVMELGDNGYPLNPDNWLLITLWDNFVLDYLPSMAANGVDGDWLLTYELGAGGFARLIHGTRVVNNPVQNGTFDTDLTGWSVSAAPNPTDLVTAVNGGVLEMYRVPAAPDPANYAVFFQPLGLALQAHTAIGARFDIGNSSSERKRLTVILHDADFLDLAVCSFWLEPGAPLRTYEVRGATTKTWTNATISFYLATEGAAGGAYRLDNVSVFFAPLQPTDRTECEDPTAPSPVAGAPDSAEMLQNGAFALGLTGWTLYGQIAANVTNGVLQFVRPPGTPAGVVLQMTGVPVAANVPISATFELGNSSTVRKRVTAILHDADFSDLAVCAFWIEPSGQALTMYTMRAFTTRAWANATVSFYLGSPDTNEWARVDNVSLKQKPALDVLGVECLRTPGGAPNATAPDGAARVPAPAGGGAAPPVAAAGAMSAPSVPVMLNPDAPLSGAGGWTGSGSFAPVGATPAGAVIWASAVSGGGSDCLTWTGPIDLRDTTAAALQFASLRAGAEASALVQVSVDGLTWTTVGDVPAGDGWRLVTLDLDAFAGQVVFIRFVHAPTDAGRAEWYLTGLTLVRGVRP